MWRILIIRGIRMGYWDHRFLSHTSQTCKKFDSLRKEYYVVSVINGFLSVGLVNKAVSLFNKYRRHGHQFDIDLYNNIIQSWVQKGNNTSAMLFFEDIVNDGLSPNFQTYGIMLGLFSRCGDWKSVDGIINQMRSKGYKLEHILYQTSFSKDHVDQILKVFRYCDIPSVPPPVKGLTYPNFINHLYKTWGIRNSSKTDIDKIKSKAEKPHILMDKDVAIKAMERQLDIECKGYERIRSVSNGITKRQSTEASNDMVSNLFSQWKSDLISVLNKDCQEFMSVMQLLSNNDVQPPKQFPFLALLPAEKWASIIMDEILPELMKQPNGLPVQYICISVGRSARTKYALSLCARNGYIDKIKTVYKEFMKRMLDCETKPTRKVWNEIELKFVKMGSVDICVPKWSKSVYYHTVAAALERLLEVASIPRQGSNAEWEPGLEHIIKVEEGYKKLGYIRPTKHLYDLIKKSYSKENEEYFSINSALLPMLVPPKPWISPECGGYLITPTFLVRCKEDAYQHQLLLETASNLHPIYDSLNYLSTCPWKINKKILRLVIEIFNDGGDEKLKIPSYPFEESILSEPTKNQKLSNKEKNEQYSLWMDMLYRLSLCNHYKDDIIWLPHNMDFRGRVYPIPPHLSHLTMDVGRSLMTFATGYPLGSNGLDWLKIHLVNLHGLKKKVSLKKRLEYANEMMEEIIDSANNPLKGNRWWMSGDDPWQVLACCMEIANAVHSENPDAYISHLPVHQDGSCNGLQHYSALGRDFLGGQKVNLLPSEEPEDTYAGVATMVEEKRKKDAESGNNIAKLLEGKINRKVVKQTVMTIVYGVTRIGGRLQVERQLRITCEDDQLWDCSNYVTGQIFAVLNEMFHNARDIQDWLADSARKISLAGRPVEWVTPLGLPVVQPYHKPTVTHIKTPLQSLEDKSFSESSGPPNVRKQKMGMPPNYVHSLDSTHMMLTALYCARDGVPFVSVHDSYWSHACFINKMNEICREQFVNLHNQPILCDLENFWADKYGRLRYKDPKSREVKSCNFNVSFPSRGDLDLNEVLKSVYFFN